MATIKYDSAGTELWVARYDNPAEPPTDPDYGSDIAVDEFGNVFVTGNLLGRAVIFYLTVKYDRSGNKSGSSVLTG